VHGVWTRFFKNGKIRCGKIEKTALMAIDKDGNPTDSREFKNFTERLFTYKSIEKAQQHLLDCAAYSTC